MNNLLPPRTYLDSLINEVSYFNKTDIVYIVRYSNYPALNIPYALLSTTILLCDDDANYIISECKKLKLKHLLLQNC